MPVYKELLTKGFILRPLANYKMPHHLRITVGTEQQNLQLLNALEQVL